MVTVFSKNSQNLQYKNLSNWFAVNYHYCRFLRHAKNNVCSNNFVFFFFIFIFIFFQYSPPLIHEEY